VGKQFIASSIEKVSFGTSVIGKLGQFVKSEAKKSGKKWLSLLGWYNHKQYLSLNSRQSECANWKIIVF